MLERRQGFDDPPLTECEVCSGELRRVLQPVQVIFKGPGFYSTDYRAKSPTESEPKTSSSAGEDKASSSDSAKTATPAKTEATPSTSTSSDAAKSD
jgi:predicted nucleic acid-binding Zn ribbon protein